MLSSLQADISALPVLHALPHLPGPVPLPPHQVTHHIISAQLVSTEWRRTASPTSPSWTLSVSRQSHPLPPYSPLLLSNPYPPLPLCSSLSLLLPSPPFLHQGNKLHSLPSLPPSLVTLALHDNPWHCDCR